MYKFQLIKQVIRYCRSKDYTKAEIIYLINDINPFMFDGKWSDHQIGSTIWIKYGMFRGLGTAIKNYLEVEKKY